MSTSPATQAHLVLANLIRVFSTSNHFIERRVDGVRKCLIEFSNRAKAHFIFPFQTLQKFFDCSFARGAINEQVRMRDIERRQHREGMLAVSQESQCLRIRRCDVAVSAVLCNQLSGGMSFSQDCFDYLESTDLVEMASLCFKQPLLHMLVACYPDRTPNCQERANRLDPASSLFAPERWAERLDQNEKSNERGYEDDASKDYPNFFVVAARHIYELMTGRLPILP